MNENAPADQKKILNIYAMFSASLLLTLVPLATAAGLATILFIGVFIAAYVYRGKEEHDSLMADHMTFIIRTIWIASLLAMFTIGAAAVYLFGAIDPGEIMPCSDRLLGLATVAEMEQAIRPCVDSFVHANMKPLINGTIIGGGPILVYMMYRIAKGVTRAAKGFRIGDNKSWF